MSIADLSPRAFRPETDLAALAGFLTARESTHAPPDYWHAGKSAVGTFQAVLDSPPADHVVWIDAAGDIQALSWICGELPETVDGESNTWRLLIHPHYRTPDALAGGIDHAERALEDSPVSGRPTTTAYGRDALLCEQLRIAGYERARALDVYMSRTFDAPVANAVTPAGYTMRPFNAETDLRERAGAQRDAFTGETEADDWSIANVRRFMRWEEARTCSHLVVLTGSGDVASFALFTVDPVLQVGELDPVGTRGVHQRRGLSRAVLLQGLGFLQANGMRRAVVRTGVDNLPAIRLYMSRLASKSPTTFTRTQRPEFRNCYSYAKTRVQELQDSIEQPGRVLAQSGRFSARCARSGCSA